MATRTDEAVRNDVEAEIKYDPSIDSKDLITVAVKDGVVTLAGVTKSYIDSYYAEKAAKRVAGVRAVANDIVVKFSVDRLDPEIAAEAAKALRSELPNSSDKIKIVVKNGWLTLEGEVEWNFQKEWAERAVRSIRGVKGVSNVILLKPKVAPGDLRKKIEDALVRSAQLDAQKIDVAVDGSKITLKGAVRSWAERKEAERAAWSAPGVTTVVNEIRITP